MPNRSLVCLLLRYEHAQQLYLNCFKLAENWIYRRTVVQIGFRLKSIILNREECSAWLTYLVQEKWISSRADDSSMNMTSFFLESILGLSIRHFPGAPLDLFFTHLFSCMSMEKCKGGTTFINKGQTHTHTQTHTCTTHKNNKHPN